MAEWEAKQREADEEEMLRKEIDQEEERLKRELEKATEALVRSALRFFFSRHPADTAARVCSFAGGQKEGAGEPAGCASLQGSGEPGS